ncbi:MAG: flagellar hook-associated protein FlgL [Desulfarculus sp.]|nr:flagellar hook-associated protein FlgL [Desulfarculus sp.]
MRVSQQMLYRQTLQELMRMRAGYAEANAQASTGKRINDPSDDPVGSITSQFSQRTLEQVTQYTSNVGAVKDWLKQSESTLQGMVDLLHQAQTKANLLSTGTYTPEQRGALAIDIQGILDELIAMGNTQVNGRYIFGGTRTDSQTVSGQILAETPAALVGSHTGGGRLYGQGTYTGLYSRNITLTVDAAYPGGVPSALNPMDVDYSYVDDFGRAISGTVTLTGTGSGNALALGDGVTFYADGSSFVAGEQYTLAVGRQHGNTEVMEANLSQENRMSFNHTLQQIFGAEGNSGGAWNNLLDQLTNWKDALDKDSKTQAYFEAVPATGNNLASTADLKVSGDWDDAQYRAYKFHTGGPIQSDSTAASRAAYRNFTVDAGYAGGVPSVANPMTVNYEWFDSSGPGWTATTVVVNGTGAGNSVTLQNLGAVPPNPPAAVVNLVDAAYTPGQALPLAGSATVGAPPYIATPATPTAGQPVMVTYTYLDQNRVPQWGSVTFTGSGDAPTDVLSLNPPGEMTLRLNAGGTLMDGDSWDLTLQQYNQGQTESQEMLTSLAAVRTNLLRYTGDVGAKLNRLEVRDNLLSSDNLQLKDRLARVESADISQVAIGLQQYQTLYQASLQATAMVMGRSLADYI